MEPKNSIEWADLFVKEVVHQFDPSFKIKKKSQSWFFRFFKPVIKLINPTFFESFIFTAFGTMWVMDDFYNRKHLYGNVTEYVLRSCAHEGRHAYDAKRLFFGIFEFLYTFPQNLFLPFLLMAFMCSWWFMIPAILFLVPLPAPGRYYLEMKAYVMSKIWNKYVYKIDEDASDEHVVKSLSGYQTYYGTWPFKSWIYKDLNKQVDLNDPYNAEVVKWLEKYGFKKS